MGPSPIMYREIKGGKNFQPTEDHPNGEVERVDPRGGTVVGMQDERLVQEAVFVVLQKDDHS